MRRIICSVCNEGFNQREGVSFFLCSLECKELADNRALKRNKILSDVIKRSDKEHEKLKQERLTARFNSRHERKKRKKDKKHHQKQKKKYKPDKFLDSPAWQALRYRVIKHFGRVCMACRATNVEIHVDHIKPRSKHPALALEFSNLQILCKACNLGKSNTDETDWRTKQ